MKPDNDNKTEEQRVGEMVFGCFILMWLGFFTILGMVTAGKWLVQSITG